MEVIKQIREEPGYFAKRSGLYIAGKAAVHPLAETIKGALTPDMLMPLSGIANVIGGDVARLITIGLIAGLSAGLTQMDYNQQITHLKDIDYTEELAAKLKKPAGKITAGDLDNVAKGNRTISEKISQIKRQRNFGVFFSFAASLASMGIVALAMTHIPALAALPHASLFSLAGLPTALLQGAMGWAAYYAVKAPLHWLGDKLFGLDEETAHDRIMSLKRGREAGKAISQEQVLSVFAKANLPLDRFIEAQYGRTFDKLALADKQMAVEEIGKLAPLDRLTSDINAGKVNVTELAFAVEGEISGVQHEGAAAPKKHGLLHGMWTKMRSALHFRPHPKVEVVGVSVQSQATASSAIEYHNPQAKGGNVARLGRAKLDASMGYVKLLEQLDQQPNAPSTQTLQ